MTDTLGAPTKGTDAPVDSLAARSARLPSADRVRRSGVMVSVVGVWMGIGWALDLGAVAYLLAGIPLTIAFQVLVARRPIASLWLVGARSVRLDRVGVAIVLGLAALPLYATVMGLVGGRILDVGYGLVGVVGAVPAAFALRALKGPVRRALLRSVLTAGVVASALFLLDRIVIVGSPITDPVGAVQAFAISLLLYIPMVFVIEEVFFRGALDSYARGPERGSDVASALFVSLLWGAWHLPLLSAEDGAGRVPITLAFHVVIGLLLTIPWRRSGNLAVPGVTHALIDAFRDGLAAA